jgi:murein L,D-transpeptidase YcbB/YkuD
VDIRAGREYEIIPALRRRLAAEGYFDGDLESIEYDRPIRDAVERYQVTHQYRDNGRLTEPMVDSLNTPAADRVGQIAVSLQRWRESMVGNDAYYLFVNVPDYHTEVWREGRREMRFRTIVGSTQHFTRRETGEVVYRRATPFLDRTMRYIVFNPYWNVPQSIMLNEYDPNLEENPLWYEKNGYEVMYNENGTRWVRMLPGPGNALGEVKFLFPNEHAVYMHDTPNRALFERTNRAFSHGCMRIEDPMALAEYLLGQDRGWDRDRVDRAREDGTEQWVTLRSPVAVHVEYYVVRVDDDGNANFLSDLYRRDQPLLAARAAQVTSALVDDALHSVRVGVENALVRASEAPEPEPTPLPPASPVTAP